MTSTAGAEINRPLNSQDTLIFPFKRFSHCFIKVVNKIEESDAMRIIFAPSAICCGVLCLLINCWSSWRWRCLNLIFLELILPQRDFLVLSQNSF